MMSPRPLLVPLALLALAGCGEADAQSDPVDVTSACADFEADTFYESAGWPPDTRCEWIPFDGRTTVRLAHDLGRAPRSVAIYLSFYPDGRSSAPAAGDLARILAADGASVELKNQTNEDFFLKVVLH